MSRLAVPCTAPVRLSDGPGAGVGAKPPCAAGRGPSPASLPGVRPEKPDGGQTGTGTVGDSSTSMLPQPEAPAALALGGPEETGIVLRFLATALRAKAVVEVGTGTGANARWLLRGMRPDGVLTSIDLDADVQRRARAELGEAGVAASRLRLIAGVAAQVLPRLTEGGYDLVLVAEPPQRHPEYLAVVVRLLRPGGVVVFAGVPAEHALLPGHPVRELTRAVAADDALVPVALPLGGGLLARS